jgi:hypothetical protein
MTVGETHVTAISHEVRDRIDIAPKPGVVDA